MKKINSILFFICITSLLYGQKDSTSIAVNKILLKWTPTALIGYPSLQFAGEAFYRNNKSFQLEYGLVLPEITKANFGRSSLKGHKIRIEQRNYIGSTQLWYIAPELNAVFVNYTIKDAFSQNWATDTLTGEEYPLNSYLESVGMKRQIIGTSFKTGLQYILKKTNFLFDIYCGLGVRYVNTTFTSYPAVGKQVPPKDYFFDYYEDKENSRFAVNAIVGFKIGYQIK